MRNKSKLLVMEVVVLAICGLLMVYSSSYIWAAFKFDDPYYFFKRQAIFMIVGFVAMFFFSKINLSKLRKYNKMLFLLGIASLILVLIPGIGVARNGSRS